MDCKVTCFERVMHLVKKCQKNRIEELFEICTDYGLQDILDFGIEVGCFSKNQSSTLFDGIVMWEDLDGNYWEEDNNKLDALLEKMGVDFDELRDWRNKRED